MRGKKTGKAISFSGNEKGVSLLRLRVLKNLHICVMFGVKVVLKSKYVIQTQI